MRETFLNLLSYLLWGRHTLPTRRGLLGQAVLWLLVRLTPPLPEFLPPTHEVALRTRPLPQPAPEPTPARRPAQRIQAVDFIWVESGEQQEIVLDDGRTITVTSGGVTVIPLRFGDLPRHNPGDIIEHVNALMPPTGVNPRWN